MHPRYAQTTPPTAEPVTVAELRMHCAISDDSWDDLLAPLLVEAREILEKRLSRQFMTATWKMALPCFPGIWSSMPYGGGNGLVGVATLQNYADRQIEIEVLPVAAITKVEYIDANGSTQTLATTSYQADLLSPDRPARIKPTYGLIWPQTRYDTYNAVTVTFTAGYASADLVPAAAKRAIKLLAAHAFRYREPVSEEQLQQVVMAMDWAVDAMTPGIYS